MQPYFFPYIGYFQLLHAADRFVIYDDVAFIKQGWINRNRILINGRPSFVTVPVNGASSFRPIGEIEIASGGKDRDWAGRLHKSVENAYRRAPYFTSVFPLVEAVLGCGATRISDLAVESLEQVARYLDIQTPCTRSSATRVGVDLSGEARVIAICLAERADEYVNPVGGADLYSSKAFAAAGVTLKFLSSQPIEYRQFAQPFVASLSIIDVLMFNARDVVTGFLDRCSLT
jgi:hypothetical protein